MNEVTQTHLPILAWRNDEGRYVLIYDDAPVGELRIDENGRGEARYHDARWVFESAGPGYYRMREGVSGRARGSLRFKTSAEGTVSTGLEEGQIELNGKPYGCLCDPRKIPPKITITGAEGQPLLQFRAEDAERGKIQIDNLPAASSPQFERLVLWGLYLYVMAGRGAQAGIESRESPAPVRPDSTPAENLSAPANPASAAAAASADRGEAALEGLQEELANKMEFRRMKPKTHQKMDYAVFFAYLVAPKVFGFSRRAAITMYLLTAYHLTLTLLTSRPIGRANVISPKTHALMETLTPGMLLALPWLLRFHADRRGRNFFLGSALAVALTRLSTDYTSAGNSRRGGHLAAA